jgi:hypothetical protein
MQQREERARVQDAEFKAPDYTPAGDTLRQKTEEMERRNRAENEASKKRFADEVPAVR